MTDLKLTKRQSYWLEHYKHCTNQNMPFETYCRQNNLSSGAFAHARKTLVTLGAIEPKTSPRPTAKPGFTVVKTAPVLHTAQVAHIHLPGQIKIEVPLTLINTLLPNLLCGGQHD